MTDVAIYQPAALALSEQIQYAQAVADGSLLPEAYRGKPANVLIAVGLGQAMGLSPAESMYRIDVIQGKPTASAELIAANVRKAGHKLRVKVTEDPPSATCTIIRRDDPDEPTVITRDMAWAQRMGLTTKSNYKSQPATMLSWRAISACARLACPEALYGVGYTPDEVWDAETPTEPTAAPAPTAAARMKGLLGAPAEPEPENAEGRPLDTGSPLARAMFAAMGEAGITDRDDRLAYVSSVVGRDVTSSKEMSEDDARAVLDALEHRTEPEPAQ